MSARAGVERRLAGLACGRTAAEALGLLMNSTGFGDGARKLVTRRSSLGGVVRSTGHSLRIGVLGAEGAEVWMVTQMILDAM